MIIEGHIITNVAEMLDFCEAAIARTDDDPSTIRLHVPQDMRIAELTRPDGSKAFERCATLAPMPLYARRVADYPDRERPPSDDHFIVLSGGYEVGGFHRIAAGPSEGRWAWGASLGAAAANFVASGYAKSPDECRINIARSFRRMLTHADLRERPDARPGPPRREPAEAIAEPSPTQPYDRENDRLLGPMLRNELCITVRSGSLIVGLLTCSTHGPETWSWALTGVERPDADFIWHGDPGTDLDALDQIALAWARWTYWAGLESIAPLQRGASR